VHRGPLRENDIMKKRISVYWPWVFVLPLAIAAYVHLYNMPGAQSPLAADRVSAELARTVSYGFVGGQPASSASTIHATTQMPTQPL
jgi:hypothetical protein